MPSRVALRPSSFICAACRIQLRSRRRRCFATATSPTPEIYDVVTVGGGPVGLALLAALKSSPITSHLKTALIESQDLSKQHQWTLPPDRYSNRASSLTPSSVAFLESTGAWKHVDHSRTQPFNEMQVWDATNDASIQFDWKAEARQYNAPLRTVATMTENANLTKGLLSRINELKAEPSLLSNTRVESIAFGTDTPQGLDLSSWPVLSLSSSFTSSTTPIQIAARLLVGADGFNSPVRTFAGIASHGWDYDRHGVVATLELEPSSSGSSSYSSYDTDSDSSNNATAFQRFLPALGGPIAILPLPNDHASLVWSTTPQNAAYLKSLPSDSLVALLNAALRLNQTDIKYLFTLPSTSSIDSTPNQHESELTWRLQHTPPHTSLATSPPTILSVQENTLASFPLRFRQAASLTSSRIALAGDAAHTIHPLAGQGLNLGLADAASLAKTVEYAVEHGMDLGDGFVLERYASDRFGKGLVMGGGVDVLGRLYELGGQQDGILGEVLGKLRGVGMSVFGSRVAEEVGLKGWVMRRAEGL